MTARNSLGIAKAPRETRVVVAMSGVSGKAAVDDTGVVTVGKLGKRPLRVRDAARDDGGIFSRKKLRRRAGAMRHQIENR